MLELDQSIHINVQSSGITLSNRWCGLEMLSCNNIKDNLDAQSYLLYEVGSSLLQ